VAVEAVAVTAAKVKITEVRAAVVAARKMVKILEVEAAVALVVVSQIKSVVAAIQTMSLSKSAVVAVETVMIVKNQNKATIQFKSMFLIT